MMRPIRPRPPLVTRSPASRHGHYDGLLPMWVFLSFAIPLIVAYVVAYTIGVVGLVSK